MIMTELMHPDCRMCKGWEGQARADLDKYRERGCRCVEVGDGNHGAQAYDGQAYEVNE